MSDTKQHSFAQAVVNNLHMLRTVYKIAPSRVLWSFWVNLIQQANQVFIAVFLFRLVINGIQNRQPVQQVLGVVGVYFMLSCLAHVSRSIYTASVAPVTDQTIYAGLNHQLYEKAVSVELSCFEDESFYTRYTKAAMESNTCAKEALENTAQIVTAILGLTVMTGILAMMDIYVALFAVFPIAGNMIVTKKISNLHYDRDMEKVPHNRRKDYIKRVFFLQQYAKELRLNQGMTGFLSHRFSETITKILLIIRKYGWKAGLLDSMIMMLNMIIPFFLVSFYSIYRIVHTQTMMVGDYSVIALGVINLSFGIMNAIRLFGNLLKNSLLIENLHTFLNYTPKIAQNADGLPAPDSAPEIVFRNVTFQYHNDGKPVLKNINLTVNPGEKIAIVGYNGAGKTTLVKLLLRFYDTTDGEITVNGHSVTAYNLNEYRSLFGVAFQDYRMFAVRISDNVLMRDADPEDTQTVNEAIKTVGMFEKVHTLKYGIDNIVTREFDDSGAIFSGGEQQKLALARAYAQSAPVLILDEPSSALDPVAEHAMFETMLKVGEGKTVIFISHRLSGATLADRILYMENGEILETGSHEELMGRNGHYANMFNMQAEAYKET